MPQSFIAAPVYKGPLVIGVRVVAIPPTASRSWCRGRAASARPARCCWSAPTTCCVRLALLRGERRSTTWLMCRAHRRRPSLGLSRHPAHRHRVPAFKGAVGIVAVQATEEVLAPVTQMRNLMLSVGGLLLAVAAVVGLVFSRSMAKPISKADLDHAKIADGDLDGRRSGCGPRRRDRRTWPTRCEVFRENGLRVAQMTEAEAARIIRDQEARAAMMAELQRAFGDVVDAAVAGDFSRRVDAEFPDAELNALAVERQQPRRHGRSRPERDRRGARRARRYRPDQAHARATTRAPSPSSRHDTNAVADKLTDIVGQLQGHLARAEDRDGRNPLGRQRSVRTHHQAGGDHRGDLGGDGATGVDGGAECRARQGSQPRRRRRHPDRRRGRRR